MHVSPNTDRCQAHIMLNGNDQLTQAALISPEGLHHAVELCAHGLSHYLVRWAKELPSGMYQLAVKTLDGKRLSQAMRIG
jgi:hypothetical protein